MVGTVKRITLSNAINENKVNLFEDYYYDGCSINVEIREKSVGLQEDIVLKHFTSRIKTSAILGFPY